MCMDGRVSLFWQNERTHSASTEGRGRDVTLLLPLTSISQTGDDAGTQPKLRYIADAAAIPCRPDTSQLVASMTSIARRSKADAMPFPRHGVSVPTSPIPPMRMPSRPPVQIVLRNTRSDETNRGETARGVCCGAGGACSIAAEAWPSSSSSSVTTATRTSETSCVGSECQCRSK
jgi:hypothetical protein